MFPHLERLRIQAGRTENRYRSGTQLGVVLRATAQQVFMLLKKKVSHPEKSKVIERGTEPGPVADESGELKEFVDNYLTLADKALGFMRQAGPNPNLTISTCVHCQHTIAATSLKLLAFAENLHVCPAKQEQVPAHQEAA